MIELSSRSRGGPLPIVHLITLFSGLLFVIPAYAESFVCTSDYQSEGKPFFLERRLERFWANLSSSGAGHYFDVSAEDEQYLVLNFTHMSAVGPSIEILAIDKESGKAAHTMGYAFGKYQGLNDWYNGFCVEKR